MRANGIAYNTGFLSPIEPLDLERVRRELAIIRDDLHCNAVHLIGGDAGRIEAAARIAADLGLEVWFSPYPIDLDPGQIQALFLDCADRAERLRAAGAQVVLVMGVELTVMNRGFVDGETLEERLAQLFAGRVAEARVRLGEFLREAVAAVRERFHGRITYAAIPFEGVDWDLFDIVTLELIRNAEVAGQFREAVRGLTAQAKPVAITGFGTATWRGSGDVAPRSMEIVEHDPATRMPLRISGLYQRDEEEQAVYHREMLEIFDSEGVDSAFVYLFALDDYPHRPGGDPRDDLDLASFGIVKVLDGPSGETYPGLPWEPKAAFAAIAEQYARDGSG
ncbi:hypothetical protein Q0Z83_033960 [Actinoplanes sichuanensis]|uniref:Abortive infection protein n=1 Tax=Actinoplanes sichuanensis TaxID=512349 RepID=A0ABW4ASX4_9ACTN|nr:hypothetical protein [Actinoplanes sichuanensis]BEL05205.1 hypothetical protein Q0Z83_033960 [Actinoplanes sichuanensis]